MEKRIFKRERGRSPSEQRGIHMLSCGFPPIFSEVSGPIWFPIVGKLSEGVKFF